MSVYVDSSALVKLYVAEEESDVVRTLLTSEPEWWSAMHTLVEVRRALVAALEGSFLEDARDAFALDWASTHVLELNQATCASAADIAEQTGVRTLDALHLAAAQRARSDDLTFVTFDRRLAEAARASGLTVVGA